MKKMLKLVSVICVLAILLAVFAMVAGAAGNSGASGDAAVVSTADAETIAQNSKYLVMYLEYLTDYTTEASWEADYKTLARIVAKARELLEGGDYDPTYKNLSAMITSFAPMNAYFYNKLQDEHIAYITAINAAYDSSELYIEKLGICSEVKRYVESSDVDPTNAELAALIAQNEQRLASMDELKESYVATLYDNADSFVAIISELDETKTYNQILEILDRASEYYYSMVIADTENSTEAEVMAAVAAYNSYTAYVNETLEYSEDFKLVVSAIAGATGYSERYALLSEAYTLIDYVSTDITGVSAAISAYENAYDDYMALINGAKAELLTTQSSVVTLRSKWGSANILAIFAELIGLVIE